MLEIVGQFFRPEFIDRLGEAGFDRVYGARPPRRAFQPLGDAEAVD